MARPGGAWRASVLAPLVLPLLLVAVATTDDTDVSGGAPGVWPEATAPSSDGGCSCHLDLTHVNHTNLGGHGPDAHGGKLIRYSDVCGKGHHVRADLVMEVAIGDYEPGNAGLNGRSACGPYGNINVKYGSMVSLRARFLDPETDDVITMDRFLFSVFDLDLSGGHREKVTIRDFEEYHISEGSKVEHETVLHGSVFTSRKSGEDARCVSDPLHMKKGQLDTAITVLFKDKSEFEFTLEVMGEDADDSHNFLFGGPSALRTSCVAHADAASPVPAPGPPAPAATHAGAGCERPVDCEMSLTNLLHNNLAGRGPDLTEPENIRFGTVCHSSSGPLDLVIAAESPYKAHDVHRNGQAEGPYGRVSLGLGTFAKLRATLVHSDTNTPVRLPSFLFSFFGLCDAGSYAPTVTFHSFDSYSVSSQAKLQTVQTGVHLVIKAAGPCEGSDTPADLLMCSVAQEKEVVTVLFTDTAGFNVTLADAGPERSGGGRDFLFGGRSCVLSQGCAAAEQAPSPAQAAAATVAAPFDCHEDFYAWEDRWSTEKKAWCCDKENKGCSAAPTAAPNCDGTCKLNSEWATCRERIQWVATNKHHRAANACALAVQTVTGECDPCSSCTVETSSCKTPEPEETTTIAPPEPEEPETDGPPPFLCEAGAQESWIDEKNHYCCSHEHKGCPRLAQKFASSGIPEARTEVGSRSLHHLGDFGPATLMGAAACAFMGMALMLFAGRIVGARGGQGFRHAEADHEVGLMDSDGDSLTGL